MQKPVAGRGCDKAALFSFTGEKRSGNMPTGVAH